MSKLKLKDILPLLNEDQIKQVAKISSIDLSNRGEHYLSRCLSDYNDNVQELECALSDHFKSILESNETPLNPRDIDYESGRACATIYQWLGTNIGFSELQEAFKKGGFILTRKEIEDE